VIASAADLAAIELSLAEAAACAATGDVPVGAVVLAPDRTVLGRGHNEREARQDPTGHAELLALRSAAAVVGDWQLIGTTLAVTLEPCPMCAGAIVQARVARVIFGAWDPKSGAGGSVWDLLRDRRLTHRPEVVAGVRADACAALLDDFFAARREAEGGDVVR
jgi:tRNA(adenine34) deaminase